MKIRDLFENTSISIRDLNLVVNNVKVCPPSGVKDYWKGDLTIGDFGLTSLEGCPKKVEGAFTCDSNYITTLEFGPEEAGEFFCDDNKLLNLEHSPKKVDGTYSCASNKTLVSIKGITQEGITDLIIANCDIHSLQGAPNTINGKFDCKNNENLNSLIGMPQNGVKHIYANGCNLTSFEGAPKKVDGNVFATKNPIKTLKNIHKIFDSIDGQMGLPSSIESNVLGLLKIKNLTKISFFKNVMDKNEKGLGQDKKEISNIINQYLPNPTTDQIIDCQNELIEAGFEEYAEL